MRPGRIPARPSEPEPVAGNGLLDRRLFLRGGVAMASALPVAAVAAEALVVEPWMKTPGTPHVGYGQPAKHEAKVARVWRMPYGTPDIGSSMTPHHLLEGTITPNGLHYARHHSGVPDIDPDKHRLLIHGLVKRNLVFTLDTLARYPMESRISFIECTGNSQTLFQEKPAQVGAQVLFGQVSCAEWTGVRLSVLLDEAGIDPRAKWVLAEGADAASMSRSVPLEKIMDDALVALYQNGERVRPDNGYPMRLLLPGWEGNMNVKWLRRLMLTETAMNPRDEFAHNTVLLPDGKALQFIFPQETKSFIARPSPGLTMQGPGIYEISGLAWSGYGRVAKVEVSADGGKSWAEAMLQPPVLSKALTRFRLPWSWDGGPAVLQSRATDDTGFVQPTREKLIAARGSRTIYHCNAIASWAVGTNGEVRHVYA